MGGKSAVGRTGALRLYKYPERQGSGAVTGPFARNFAKGPATDQPVVTTGTVIDWGSIDVPADPPTNEDVPITPVATGVVRVIGVVTILNDSVNANTITVQIQVDGVTVTTPAPQVITGEAGEGGREAIPFLAEITGLPLGTPALIRVLVTTSADSEVAITANDSTLEVQEVPAATG